MLLKLLDKQSCYEQVPPITSKGDWDIKPVSMSAQQCLNKTLVSQLVFNQATDMQASLCEHPAHLPQVSLLQGSAYA